MIIKVIIPTKLDEVLNKCKKNKTYKKNLIKVYSAFVYLKENKPRFRERFFDVPSNYLQKVNGQYEKYLKLLLENKIINYYSNSDQITEENLFGDGPIIRKKFYQPKWNMCMKYTILVNTEIGREVDIEMPNLYEGDKWYELTKSSLYQIGLDGNIKRDSFNRRLHTRVTHNTGVTIVMDDGDYVIDSYKEFFKLYYPGEYSIIDAKSCFATLLNELSIRRGIKEEKFNELFSKGEDFYQYLLDQGIGKDKKSVKKIVATWFNGEYKHTNKRLRELFPKMDKFINKLKIGNYKALGQLLGREESSIFVDGILNNIDLNFCLTVHDSIIIKNEDLDYAYNYIIENYSETLEYKIERL